MKPSKPAVAATGASNVVTDKVGAGTRRTILQWLKEAGPRDSGALAVRLGVSTMAVRQHLYALQQQGLVEFEAEPRPVGRPAKLWRLTPAADRLFPEGYADLTLGLLESLRETFGSDGVGRLLQARAEKQMAGYQKQMPARAPLVKRLQALAAIRTREGYMAEVQPQPDGSFMLIENHCPVCLVARTCTGLCGAEMQVFRGALGPDVTLERTEHILSGARRCAYHVKESAQSIPGSAAAAK